ncbi:MAG: tetratricopeptide repeat protein [Planctomycetota bacterium]
MFERVARMRTRCLVAFAWCVLCVSCYGPTHERPHVDRELEERVDAWESARRDGDSGRDQREQLEQLALRHPAHASTLLACGFVAHEDRDVEGAQRWLDAALRLQPRNADATWLRACIALELGNLPAAERMTEQQLRSVPDHAGLHEMQASVRYFQGDLKGARESLERAETLGAPGWRVQYHLGLIAEGLGELEKAREHYDRCLEERPKHDRARSRRNALRLD